MNSSPLKNKSWSLLNHLICKNTTYSCSFNPINVKITCVSKYHHKNISFFLGSFSACHENIATILTTWTCRHRHIWVIGEPFLKFITENLETESKWYLKPNHSQMSDLSDYCAIVVSYSWLISLVCCWNSKS